MYVEAITANELKCHDLEVFYVTKDFISEVWEDGRISLKCKNNGLYLKFGMEGSILETDVMMTTDPCTELGVCDHCKFNIEIGTLSRVDIEIIGIEFGEFNDDIPSTPDIVASDDVINYSDQIIESQFKVM